MTLHLTPESALALATALHDPAYALQAKRKAAADAIEDLINFLDETEGDCDLEPTLGAPEVPPQTMVPGGPHGWHVVQGTQERWADGCNAVEADDCEDQNEDGGDVLDTPHDGFLGWPEDVTVQMDTSTWYLTDAELDDADDEESDLAGGDINDEPHDDEGDREYDLCFNFGLGSMSGEFDGPRDIDWNGVRDRPDATLFAAEALRLADARRQGEMAA